MRKSLLVSFWCSLLSNCLALKAAGVATPKMSPQPLIGAFGAGADSPTLNLFVAEPENTRENGEHARHSWLPVQCSFRRTCAVCRRVAQEGLIDSEKVSLVSRATDKGIVSENSGARSSIPSQTEAGSLAI